MMDSVPFETLFLDNGLMNELPSCGSTFDAGYGVNTDEYMSDFYLSSSIPTSPITYELLHSDDEHSHTSGSGVDSPVHYEEHSAISSPVHLDAYEQQVPTVQQLDHSYPNNEQSVAFNPYHMHSQVAAPAPASASAHIPSIENITINHPSPALSHELQFPSPSSPSTFEPIITTQPIITDVAIYQVKQELTTYVSSSSSVSSSDNECCSYSGCGSTGSGSDCGAPATQSKAKARLARKAELARLSRKRKKTRLEELEREVADLKEELAAAKRAKIEAGEIIPETEEAPLLDTMTESQPSTPCSETSMSSVYSNFPTPTVQRTATVSVAAALDSAIAAVVSRIKSNSPQEGDKPLSSLLDDVVRFSRAKQEQAMEHLTALGAHTGTILPLTFMNWICNQNDKFVSDPSGLWSSLWSGELAATPEQQRDMLALRTTVRNQHNYSEDVARVHSKLLQQFTRMHAHSEANLERLRSILTPEQMAKYIQWCDQYAAICIKINV